jgi:drug/metabolite transporter, DME family
VARLQVVLAAVLFGTTGTAQALGPDGLTPLTVGAARIVIGGTALALLALATGSLRGPWSVRALLLAGVGVAVYQLAFFEAVALTGVAVGAIVAIGSGPVAAGLLERLLDGAWPGRTWAVATALATAGVAILTLASRGDAELSVAGIGLALLAGCSYAGYTVVAKRLLRDGHEPAGVMGASFGIAAVLLVPVLLVGDTAWLVEPGGLALALYLGLLPTAVAYVLFARGLDRLTASEVTTIVLVEPLTATLLGVLVLDERLGAVAGVGAALVLLGLAVLGLAPRTRAPSPVAAEAALDDAL